MRRILLVEDDARINEALTAALTEAGFDVRAVATRAEAIDAGHNLDFAAVITDLSIPPARDRLASEKHGLAVVRFFAEKGIPIMIASFSFRHLDGAVSAGAKITVGDKTPKAVLAALKEVIESE